MYRTGDAFVAGNGNPVPRAFLTLLSLPGLASRPISRTSGREFWGSPGGRLGWAAHPPYRRAYDTSLHTSNRMLVYPCLGLYVRRLRSTKYQLTEYQAQVSCFRKAGVVVKGPARRG